MRGVFQILQPLTTQDQKKAYTYIYGYLLNVSVSPEESGFLRKSTINYGEITSHAKPNT
jgi:hypothetical protein